MGDHPIQSVNKEIEKKINSLQYIYIYVYIKM